MRPGHVVVAGTVMGGSSLVLGLVVVLLIGIMLPALGAARRTARRMQNSTQLRGVHQGMVTFGNSNKENFPGLTSKGNILEDAAEITGMSGHGGTTEARMWILLDGNFFTPEYAISPSETSAVTEYNTGMLDTTAAPVEFTAGTTGLRHYSYAFLAIHQDATVPNDTHSVIEIEFRLRGSGLGVFLRSHGIDRRHRGGLGLGLRFGCRLGRLLSGRVDRDGRDALFVEFDAP